MKRLVFAFVFAVTLYAASPVGQAFADYHVRPPDKARGDPIPTETKWISGEVPAWIQAIGTLLAFAGAIYFSNREHRRSTESFEKEWAREEGIRRLRAHSLAHALYADLLELKAKINARDESISKQLERKNKGFTVNVAKGWEIGVPEGYQSAGDLFYLLGTDTAPLVSELRSLLDQHNRVASELSKNLVDPKKASASLKIFFEGNLFANRLQLMKQDVEQALYLVGKIRDKQLLPDYTFRPKNDEKENVGTEGIAADPDDIVSS